ncbi:MAG: glycoside hydrolase family 3 protein, partial [Bifidobacteriaceae bacterium]|nr:glycoside hydrolase family 3 protein [Bifidobacteriaceae bacterium]
MQKIDSATSELIDSKISKMTLEEKVGQLGSYWYRPLEGEENDNDSIDSQSDKNFVAPAEDQLTSGTNFRDFERISKAGLSHLTRVWGGVPQSKESAFRRIEKLQNHILDHTSTKIPAILHEECLTGVNAKGATIYAAPLSWGASFNPELIKKLGFHIGHDMKAMKVHQGLAPLLDVIADARWGRCEEAIGEDPYLVGMIGSAYIQGIQENGIIATAKHFAAYPASRAARNHAPVDLGKRELYDKYLLPFQMAVQIGNVKSVMNAYNDIDGIPCAVNKELLETTLRDEWGFRGTVVSDYQAVSFVHDVHNVAADYSEAAALCIKAGIDIELPETQCYTLKSIKQAIENKILNESDIDKAVKRVLAQKAELGLLESSYIKTAAFDENCAKTLDLDSSENRALAKQLAEESIVLLKNDCISKGEGNFQKVLPLNEENDYKKIAIIGPAGLDAHSFLGCYSFPNHVFKALNSDEFGIDIENISEHFSSKLQDSNIQIASVQGCPFQGGEVDKKAVKDAISGSDLVLLAVGDTPGLFGNGTSGEGTDALDLRLPGKQDELVKEVLSLSDNVILVVTSGRPYCLTEYLEKSRAILQTFLPGIVGAKALYNIIFGKVNPSGKLPVSLPKYIQSHPFTYLEPKLG